VATGFRTPLYSIFLAGLTLGHQAFWPIVIAESVIGGLFTFLTLVSVLLLLRTAREGNLATSAAAGLILGLDVLTRATIAPFGLLAPFWLGHAHAERPPEIG